MFLLPFPLARKRDVWRGSQVREGGGRTFLLCAIDEKSRQEQTRRHCVVLHVAMVTAKTCVIEHAIVDLFTVMHRDPFVSCVTQPFVELLILSFLDGSVSITGKQLPFRQEATH
jgi:hypothetical protein